MTDLHAGQLEALLAGARLQEGPHDGPHLSCRELHVPQVGAVLALVCRHPASAGCQPQRQQRHRLYGACTLSRYLLADRPS